nr:CoA-binding protein [Salinispora arenicola]
MGVGAAVLGHLRDYGFTGAVVPVHPSARTVAGLPAYPSAAEAGLPVDLAVVAVPPAAVEAVVADAASAGGARPGRHQRGLRRGRGRRRGRAAPAGSGGPCGGHADHRPELPGGGEHQHRGTAERHAGPTAAGPRPGWSVQPVRRVRGGAVGRGGSAGAGAVQLRVCREPGRRLR